GAWSNAKEAKLGIDGAEDAVLVEAHPGNVITDTFDLVARQAGREHGQICLAASRGECRGDVLLDAFRAGNAKNEHVLGEPAFALGENGTESEGKALLAEQRVATVARAEGDDL